MRKLITLSLLSLVALSAMAENIKTIVYTTDPVMTCQNCEKKIKSNVRFVKGVKRIDTSLNDQTVTIVYDADKAKPEDIEAAFAKIGRKVTEVSATDRMAAKTSKDLKNAEKTSLKAGKVVEKDAKKADKKLLKDEKTLDKNAKKGPKALKDDKTVVAPKKK